MRVGGFFLVFFFLRIIIEVLFKKELIYLL